MKLIFELLKNFKNLLPYFLLIALYFFFINLETRKEKVNNKIDAIEKQLADDKYMENDKEYGEFWKLIHDEFKLTKKMV